ncbi:hypothetical protein QFZ58_001821 [Streptomyces sp. B1I3]|nr:hypothetical protein [Streptomyces sp. B1I3]
MDDNVPLLTDDPLGVDTFATHHLPLGEGSEAYKTFQDSRTASSRRS